MVNKINKVIRILFDICVLPALIVVYLLLYIKITVQLTILKEKYDVSYMLYLTKLNLDVVVSEYPVLMNACFVIISSVFYYASFFILN